MLKTWQGTAEQSIYGLMTIHQKTHRSGCTIVLASLLIVAAAAETSAKALITANGDWEAYTTFENKSLVCYMGAEPQKTQGKYTKRGQTFLLITHRPSEKSKNVISLRAGYTYKKSSEVKMIIGKERFELFTNGQWAFAADAGTDNKLVKSMIRGAELIVRGVSSRGTQTTDTYSLKGFTAAYKAIGKACKI